ncbi:MAM and LDL-receptor class A domain-containing protein 2 [Ixodes scapularis]|uniref:MAM and LDL-receptor class A domain-containing protein 2 n=1 Tax=Ixodes scapularis TaxID=6945 RepID=UPI001A9F0285|nr:MAM and LDL-receptor class A domain-containing protein 2 [Ixodes scapularis]
MSLLWEAEGGEFDDWKLGRLALSGKTRVIFEGIAAGALPPGYVALDDIRIFPNESCDPSPKNASSLREADDILNCDFGKRSFCKWSFTAKTKGVGWLFADMTAPVFNVGPRPLPKGVSGSFIHTNRVQLAMNGGSMQLNSMNVPSLSGLWCATLWYHMFGGLETRLQVTRLALQSDAGSAEMWAPFSVLYREGRTIADSWYSVQRTLDMNARSNRLEIRYETMRYMPSETAIGPIQVSPGACRAVTESQGLCDFEYEMCGWISNKPDKGWRRKEAKLTGMAANTRSGPVDSQYFMELRGGVGSNDAALFSPWFEGRPEPQCLKFWYKRDSLTLGRIAVEVTTGGGGPRNIVWTQPPYPKNDWMLASIPVSQAKRFQVVIRGNITDRRNTQSALGFDDVEVSPEPCKPLLECGFEDDLCGYVSDYSSEFKWLVGTGRVVRPRLQTQIPKPPSSQAASDGGKSSWTRFAYVDFTVPSGDPFGSETQAPGDGIARLFSPIFDVGETGDTVQLTFFRKGKAIESMELSQVAYQENGTTTNLLTVRLPEGEAWKSISSSLKPSSRSQLVITLKRKESTDGAAAISVISSGGPSTTPTGESSLSCDFENGTFCGWNATVGVVPFKMNDPANQVPAFPKSDHTLRAFRGRFIYVDSRGKKNAQADLQSPVIPEKVRDNFCFSIWHWTLPNTRGFLTIYDTVKLHPVFRPLTTVSHHWAHTLFQMQMPAKGDRITVRSYMFNGLLALDDLQITPGSCPEPDKCTFEWGSFCRVYREIGSARFWQVAPSDSLNIFDHTLRSLEGNYLYINTTNVDPAQREARAFLAERKPTPATCLTFWWKGFGTPSNLNIYLHTKETILRDPILSVYTRSTPLWWNVRYVTISSKLTWKLTFEAVSATSKVQSGVMVDDIEFTEGECPSEELCTFEEDICVPWEQMVTVNASGLNKGWEVQRADQSDILKKDHTLASGEGYYLMFRSTGNKLDSASLVLRQPRFQCGSLWYFISSKSPNGVIMNVKNRIFHSPTKSWKRVIFSLVAAGEQRIIASAGNDKKAFLAIDDLLVDEKLCKNMVPGSEVLDNFTCGNGDTIPTSKVCDFVKDCKDGSDEVDCGACDFKKSTCGWTYPNVGYLPNWQRKRVGEVEGSPKLSAAGLTTGFYMLHQRHPPMDMVISDSPLNGPTIRNTNYACVLNFWYNYNRNNNSAHMDLMMKVNGRQINIWSLRYVYPLPDERTWWHTRILLGRYAGDVKLYFAAFGWPWKEGYFAIDEISYAFCGLPPKVASCNVQEFRCANGACIPQLQVCNYVDNCGDGSDEVNCGDHNSGCNFDASFCDWKPIVPAGGVNPGWIRKKPGGNILRQPTRDHTSGLYEGQFLQLDAGSSKVDAEIAGPILESSSLCTVTFFHTIYGSVSSTLTFGIRYKTGGPLIPLWRRTKPTGFFHFIEAYMAFRPLAPFQVFFRGMHNATTNPSYIAIDDVSFYKGCRPYHGKLPVEPVTPRPIGPALCPEGQFTCVASRQCIPLSQVCDFKPQCSDGSDEKNCGACDFSTDLCGLTTDYPNAKFTWNRTSAEEAAKSSSGKYILPTKDRKNNPQGFYVAFRLTNTDVPRGDPNALLTPPLGQMAHSCTVDFYTFLSATSLSLWFGAQRNRTSDAPAIRRRLALLKGSKSNQTWTKMSVRVGNWNPGVRFYFMTDHENASIDGIQYRGCHPDKDSETYEAGLLVTCSFIASDMCGWFPENLEDELDWVKFGFGQVTRLWQPPFADVGHTGFYMFATNPLNKEARAHLVSKRVDATDNQGRCFSFWYSMRHPNSGTLNLLLRMENNSSNLLWTRSGPQGRSWARGHVEFYADRAHKFVLEAILLASTPAVIAVDEIRVTRGECEDKALSCDFEYSGCGWKLNGWEMNSGRKIGTPDVDHTTETGYGVYARLKSSVGHLASPLLRTIKSSERRCVKFWFYLSGREAEQLNVTRVVSFSVESVIWAVRASQVPQRKWLSGSVDLLGDKDALMVAFIGATSSAPDTAVAVDDILIDEKGCPSAASCDFEDDFCNWWNVGNKTSAMQWYRNSGPTMTDGGPSVDHTLNTPRGTYLLLDAQDLSTVQEGVVESEIIAKASDAACFRLFYQIANGSDASLAVEVRDASGPIVSRWTVTARGNNSWTPFSQDLNNLPSEYTIRISGTPGKQQRSDVAIDDISLFSGKCPERPTATTSASSQSTGLTTVSTETTQSSTESGTTPPSEEKSSQPSTSTSAPQTTTQKEVVTCAPGQFNCRDNKNCIPLALLCDGVKDCSNGIDEKCGGRNQCTPEFSFCPSGVPQLCFPRQYRCDDHQDCSDGSDESLCGYCPSYYCRNGGRCDVASDKGSPSCTCPEGTAGERCQFHAPAAQRLKAAASNGWAIALPVILILVAAGAGGFLFYRRRKALNTPVFLNNPTYNASTAETRILD